MWIYLEPYVMPVTLVVVLIIIGRVLIKKRLQGKKSGCSHGCSLGCFGVICLVVIGGIISSFFGTKTLYCDGNRRWYMHTLDIDGETFYNVGVSPTKGLPGDEGQGYYEPWYTCIGFQGGTAGWKKYPTELYLRQQSGPLLYFNFETGEVQDVGHIPADIPMQPVEKFFREL